MPRRTGFPAQLMPVRLPSLAETRVNLACHLLVRTSRTSNLTKRTDGNQHG